MIEIRELVLKAQVNKKTHLERNEKYQNNQPIQLADIKKHLEKLSER